MNIPYGRQHITKDDIQEVNRVLLSDFLTQGPEIDNFEINFAKYVNSKYAVAVSNGTAALHACTSILKIKKNQKVITTSLTFAATANCVKYCGGEVVFVDIDPNTYLIDINKIEKLLEKSKPGEYCGIISVDLCGRAVDSEKINKISEKYDLWFIQDCCHSPGAFFKDSNGNIQKSGSSNFSDMSIFSLHPVKHIAAGEGGVITTNSKEYYEKLKIFRSHGITKSGNFKNSIKKAWASPTKKKYYPKWYYEEVELGYNYRLTDFQAVLANSQLKRAESGIKKRRKIAQKYYNYFKNKPYIINQSGFIEGHAYHLYVINVLQRNQLYEFLLQNNIFCQIHYIPLYYFKIFEKSAPKEGLKHNEDYYKSCISLPMYPTLKDSEQNFVIEKINQFYKL